MVPLFDLSLLNHCCSVGAHPLDTRLPVIFFQQKGTDCFSGHRRTISLLHVLMRANARS